jgi:glycine hydroxymethyltransferase
MYLLRRLYGPRFDRVNAIVDSLEGHVLSYINLIGSASLPFPEVCAMEGLPGTACRTEGHRSSRLFPATDPIDLAEQVIEDRTRKLFGLDDSYLVSGQPHSATQANHAVLRATIADSQRPVAAMAPSDGGHISHRFGAPPGSQFVPFPLASDGIDYDGIEVVVRRHRPAVIVAGGTSYTRAIDYERLRDIADSYSCHLHADLAHTAPFVATGLHPPAFPFADSATIDTSKNLRGPRGGILIFRQMDSSVMERAIFPILQSSPNQCGLIAKAACLSCWSADDLLQFSHRMVRLARILASRLQEATGPPIFGGTDTHLLLFDLSNLPIDGRQAEDLLERERILVNRNQVPGDQTSPWKPAGIRLSSTVLAILDYSEHDVRLLGDAICTILRCGQGESNSIDRLLETYHQRLISNASEPTSGASTDPIHHDPLRREYT